MSAELYRIRSRQDHPSADGASSRTRSRGLRAGLTPRLTFVFVGFGLAILVGVASLAFFNGRAALERATIAGLTAVAIEKEARLDSWFDQKVSEIRLLAVSPYLVTTLSALLDERPANADAARDRLNDFLSRIWLQTGGTFSSIFALDAQTGKIVAATDSRDVGKFKEDRAYFIDGLNGPYIQGPYYSLPEGGPSIVFAAPIKAADGRSLGVVAGQAKMAELQALIQRRSGDGSTDDNFIVNKAGLFVTQPRYMNDQAPLRFGTQSDYVKQCLAGNSGAALADDYRPAPVIAIYRWIAPRQFCLVAKVDQAEALAPVLVFRNSILLTAVVVLLVASTIAVVLARSITRPIKILHLGAERLGRGERNFSLPEGSRDELGALARAFNRMAHSLTEGEAELKRRAEELRRENAERRRAEDEVRGLNATLERRVAARTAELATVNRELESFAYSVSHDLRAPLRHMDGFSEALIEDYGDKLDDAAKGLLARIRNASVRMGRLIDDLLKLSRVSRGEIERSEVDLSAMAHRIVRELAQADPHHHVAIEVEPNIRAQVDERLMEIALGNLLGNAWKFSAKNPHAKITFGVSHENRRPTYVVRDNGVGFDMAYVGKLFAPFQRLHTAAEFEGTGIGLATVSRIIQRHGGDIRIASAVGEGTTVQFTI